MNIAIVGATGNVGRKMLEVLERKKLPIKELFLVASPRSAGQKINLEAENMRSLILKHLIFQKFKLLSSQQVEKFQKNMLQKQQSIQQL